MIGDIVHTSIARSAKSEQGALAVYSQDMEIAERTLLPSVYCLH